MTNRTLRLFVITMQQLVAVSTTTVLAGCYGSVTEPEDARRDEVLNRFFTPEAAAVLKTVPLTPGVVPGTGGFAVGDDIGSRLWSALSGYGWRRQVIVNPSSDDFVIMHEYVHQADYFGLIDKAMFHSRYDRLRNDSHYDDIPVFYEDYLEQTYGLSLIYNDGITRELVAFLVSDWARGDFHLPAYFLETYKDVIRFEELVRDRVCEKQTIQAAGAVPGERFGQSVAVDGSTAVVGIGSSGAGAAVILRRRAGTWEQLQRIEASDYQDGDLFGSSVAISGRMIASGAPHANNGDGAVYLFQYERGYWIESRRITSSAPTARGFGSSVAISDDVAVVATDDPCSTSFNCSEPVTMLRFNGTSWSEEQRLTTESGQAAAVAVEGNTLAIGTWDAINIFRFDGTLWVEQQTIRAERIDEIGIMSISINGDRILVSAIGGVHLYHLDGGAWVFEQLLVPNRYGLWCATLSGDLAVLADSLGGSATIFRFSGTSWVLQQSITSPDGNAHADFGESVGISDNQVIVGAPSVMPSGTMYIYEIGREECVNPQPFIPSRYLPGDLESGGGFVDP